MFNRPARDRGACYLTVPISVLLLAAFCAKPECFGRPVGPPQETGAVPLSQGIAQLASNLAKGIPQGQAMTIAVTDFPERKQVCGLGQFVAERLSTLMSRQPQCRLIERRRLDMVLQELKFSMSELVDPAKARKLGQMLGVQGLVVGTITDLGATFDVDARIIDIQTDMSLPGASASIVKDEAATQLSSDCGSNGAAADSAPAFGGSNETSASEPTRSAKAAIRRVTVKEFTFEVRCCTLAASRMECPVMITNGGADRQVAVATGNISMPAPTRVIDESGNEYSAETVQLGNRSSTYSVASSIPTGVPVAAKFVFGNVPELTSAVPLLEIPFYVVDREMLKAQIRSVAICADSPRPGSASPQTGSGSRQRGTAPPARLNPTGLDKRQILDLLRGDVPSARIAELVKEKGLKFSLSAKDLGDVRAQGGDDELIDAISRAPGPDR